MPPSAHSADGTPCSGPLRSAASRQPPEALFVRVQPAFLAGLYFLQTSTTAPVSAIDPAAGIILQKKTGDAVKQGETIAKLYASDQKLFATAAERYQKAIVIGEEKPAERPLVLARVEKGAVEMF